jgi:hypothetical protein
VAVTPETCRAEKQRKIKNIELLHLVGILFIKSRCTDKQKSNLLCVFVYLLLLITVVYHGLSKALALQFAYSL